jgi:hypothetical protein
VASAYVVGVEGDIAYANEAAIFHGSPYPANTRPNSLDQKIEAVEGIVPVRRITLAKAWFSRPG